MDYSLNGHIDQGNIRKAAVWFNGSGALVEGQGLCYNWDYGTAGTREPRRGNEVELPTILNARYFAGVTARAYNARTGGQLVEIHLPGSVCNVMTGVDTVIGVGRITCQAGAGGDGAGHFGDAGFAGQGSAVPLQTVTAGAGSLCLARLEEGPQSGLIEYITAVAGANVCMVGGVTYIIGASVASDATFTLADGPVTELRKAFIVVTTAVTTNNFVVTVTSGVQGILHATPTTALASLTFNAIGETSILEWDGVLVGTSTWTLTSNIGATIA
jgi:hypothetical protein